MVHKEIKQSLHICPPSSDNLDFSRYIEECQQILNSAELSSDNKAINAPYELLPNKPVFSKKNPNKIATGVLLIHGLLETPFVLKDIATHLQREGVLVRSVILPGHGTHPSGLLDVKWEDWYETTCFGIKSMADKVDRLYLIGVSTGASLGLLYALQHMERIAGIIMFAPVLKIYSPFAFLANSHRFISWAWPRAQWLHLNKELDTSKYSSVTFNAGYQVYLLTKAIKRFDHATQLACPLFMVLTNEDKIVSSPAAINYFCNQKHPKSQLLLYAACTKQSLTDSRITVRSSVYPKWHIDSFCHISLTVSPENPHYGMHGDFPLASHVEDNQHCIYGAMNRVEKDFYDLSYKLKLTRYQRQRLTFNPDFDYMMDAIYQFIKETQA